MEEARSEFRTKIATIINKANNCKSGTNRDNEDTWRDQE